MQNVEISMMMCYHEHHDDYKFIAMWFLDIADDVHDVICAKNDGAEKVYYLYVIILVTYVLCLKLPKLDDISGKLWYLSAKPCVS